MNMSEAAKKALKLKLEEGNHNFKEVLAEAVYLNGELVFEDVIYRDETKVDGMKYTLFCVSLMESTWTGSLDLKGLSFPPININPNVDK